MRDKPTFSDLHQKGDPLVLFNIWDAGSAQTVAKNGARALATGSASLAGALGYADGQDVPFETLLFVVRRIIAATDLPLSVDFEAGYADSADAVAKNAMQLERCGVVGVNLEDGVPPENGIRSAPEHADLIKAIAARTSLFINARTDLFLQSRQDQHRGLMSDALARAELYHQAGADGFFVPGLTASDLIAEICAACALPVNVLASPASPDRSVLAALGVARISYGPYPWRDAMSALGIAAAQVYTQRP